MDHDATSPVAAWTELAALVAARAYRALVVTLVLAASVPLLAHWTSHVVRSGSMEPGIATGDIVVARPFTDAEDVPVGRVMVFRDPAAPGEQERLLVHRVVSDLGDGTWVTRGDANEDNDTTPVTREHFSARAMILVPFIGTPLVWLTEGEAAPLLGWIVLTAAAFVHAGRRGTRGGPGGRSRRGGARMLVRALAGPRRSAPALHHAGRVARVARLIRLIRTALPLVLVTAGGVAWSGTAGAAFTAQTTSAGSSWTVSTTLSTTVSLASPGEAVRGTVPLEATLTTVSAATWTVRIEYAVSGSTSWRTLCTDTSAPYSCEWATTALGNQDYDLRAVALSVDATVVSEPVSGVQVDNALPTVLMQDPGSPLRGTVDLGASAGDAHSGVAEVTIQYAATGSSAWRDVCTSTTVPFSCRFDTTTLNDGSYAFRATAVDLAGNSATSGAVVNRTVDNRVASVSVVDPGALLTGTVTVQAVANAPSGITSVRLQRAPTGSSTWTDICTDTTGPYSCTWDTVAVPNGGYDLRAILRDGAGVTTTSTVVSNRRVDNSPLRAADVQTVQGGAAGTIDWGDRVLLTYSGLARTSTIANAWDGSPLMVSVRVRDGGLLGLGSRDDTIDVLRGGSAVNLGSINLGASYIGNNRTAQFAATMTATTVTVNGVSATRITLVLGAQTGGKAVSNGVSAGTMVWTPSTSVTDLNGRPASAAPAVETGTLDRDF